MPSVSSLGVEAGGGDARSLSESPTTTSVRTPRRKALSPRRPPLSSPQSHSISPTTMGFPQLSTAGRHCPPIIVVNSSGSQWYSYQQQQQHALLSSHSALQDDDEVSSPLASHQSLHMMPSSSSFSSSAANGRKLSLATNETVSVKSVSNGWLPLTEKTSDSTSIATMGLDGGAGSHLGTGWTDHSRNSPIVVMVQQQQQQQQATATATTSPSATPYYSPSHSGDSRDKPIVVGALTPSDRRPRLRSSLVSSSSAPPTPTGSLQQAPQPYPQRHPLTSSASNATSSSSSNRRGTPTASPLPPLPSSRGPQMFKGASLLTSSSASLPQQLHSSPPPPPPPGSASRGHSRSTTSPKQQSPPNQSQITASNVSLNMGDSGASFSSSFQPSNLSPSPAPRPPQTKQSSSSSSSDQCGGSNTNVQVAPPPPPPNSSSNSHSSNAGSGLRPAVMSRSLGILGKRGGPQHSGGALNHSTMSAGGTTPQQSRSLGNCPRPSSLAPVAPQNSGGGGGESQGGCVDQQQQQLLSVAHLQRSNNSCAEDLSWHGFDFDAFD